MEPDIRYARNGDVAIAYQVGSGDRDLVFVPDYVSNLIYAWDSRYWRETVKDLVAGSGLRFHERGAHELKGVAGTWRLYAGADSAARLQAVAQ